MNKFFIGAFILMLCSCTKYTPNIVVANNNKTTIEFSSINNNFKNGSFTIVDKWQLTNSKLNTIISNDSNRMIVILGNTNTILDDASIRIHHYTLNSNSNNIPATIYDSVFNLNSNKVHSIITAQKHIIPNGYQNFPIVIQENDFTTASSGYAKIRFIIAVPTVGPAEMNKTQEQMIPNVELTSTQHQINLATQGRYSLDNLNNPSLLNFTTIPAGTYTQTAVMPTMPGLTYTFKSGKKYTILVTRMARTQYPENDNLKVIEHSF